MKRGSVFKSACFRPIALIASALLVEFSLSATQYNIKISGGGIPVASTVPTYLPPITDNNLMSNLMYLGGISIHPIVSSNSMFIMFDVTNRGSQQIVLCLSQNYICSLSYDPNAAAIIITGDSVDLQGTLQYENTLFIAKPPGANYTLSVFMLNGRTSSTITVASIISSTTNSICLKCSSSSSSCVNNNSCLCQPGSFGRLCDRTITRMTGESISNTTLLGQYQGMHFEYFYSGSDGATTFEVTSKSSPYLLVIANEADGQDYSLLYREDRLDSTSVFPLLNWPNGFASNQLVAQRNWIGATVLNLDRSPQQVQFKMSVTTSNTLNYISIILYVLMVVAIVTLLGLTICIACMRRRARILHEQQQLALLAAANAQGLDIGRDNEKEPEKLTQQDIEKYLPLQTADELSQLKLNNKEEPCTICLDNIFTGKEVRKVLFCDHLFHSECLMDWTKQKEYCPNCKKEYNKKALKEYEQVKIPQRAKSAKFSLKIAKNPSVSGATLANDPASVPLQSFQPSTGESQAINGGNINMIPNTIKRIPTRLMSNNPKTSVATGHEGQEFEGTPVNIEPQPPVKVNSVYKHNDMQESRTSLLTKGNLAYPSREGSVSIGVSQAAELIHPSQGTERTDRPTFETAPLVAKKGTKNTLKPKSTSSLNSHQHFLVQRQQISVGATPNKISSRGGAAVRDSLGPGPVKTQSPPSRPTPENASPDVPDIKL